jgi:transposase-like protein
MKCEHCESRNIVRNGKRRLLNATNQRYLCANCGKRFSSQKGKFSGPLVLFAVSSYNSGNSLTQTVALVKRRYKCDVNASTILRWARKYGGRFLRIRKRLLERYAKTKAVSQRNFSHFGVVYPFMLHNWKLREFCREEGLREYLLKLGPWVDKYFSSGKKCSQLRCVRDVEVFKTKNFLCRAVGQALGACSDLRERHSVVQKHFLFNDSSTIATEVPVWAYDKRLGPLSGHIDVLQVRFGKVWVLDYKPSARQEDRLKVASQLYWYVRALSFRAKMPMKDFMCAWFDAEVCYEFVPSKVKLDRGYWGR